MCVKEGYAGLSTYRNNFGRLVTYFFVLSTLANGILKCLFYFNEFVHVNQILVALYRTIRNES